MVFQFATCERGRALEFLKILYPNGSVSEESAKDVLDLVEADIVRIPDPAMHGSQVGIFLSAGYERSGKTQQEIVDVLRKFHEIHAKAPLAHKGSDPR
jgi:hypothetical protein